MKRRIALLLVACIIGTSTFSQPLSVRAAVSGNTVPETIVTEEAVAEETESVETVSEETVTEETVTEERVSENMTGQGAADNRYSGTEPQKVDFQYASEDTEEDPWEITYYTDDYFRKPATTYNPSLATMSSALELASGGHLIKSEDEKVKYSRQYVNGETLLKDLDFQSVSHNADFNVKPHSNGVEDTTIGAVIGYKMIDVSANEAGGSREQIPLIAIGIRGTNYEAEWASNFLIGKNGNHEGFDAAATKVVSFLDGYLKEPEVEAALSGHDEIKVWVTGFSRAAATANLTAAKLDDLANSNAALPWSGKKLTKENIYAYTFETPRGLLLYDVPDQSNYNNIFNIINENDLVAMVAPADFGFRHYGIDKRLASVETTACFDTYKKKVVDETYLKKVPKASYVLEKHIYWKWTPTDKLKIWPYTDVYIAQGPFMKDFMTGWGLNVLKTRDNYVDNYQTPVSSLMNMLMARLSKEDMNSMKALLKKTTDLNVLTKYYLRFFGVITLMYSDKMPEAEKIMNALIDDLVKDANVKSVTNEDLKKAVDPLMTMMQKMFMTNPSNVWTLVMNELLGGTIEQAHSELLEKSWLENMDPNYGGTLNPAEVFDSGEYRMAEIEGQNLVVTVKKGETVISETVLDSDSVSANSNLSEEEWAKQVQAILEAAESEEGGSRDVVPANETRKFLPVDADYTITIKNNSKKEVTYSYSIYEFNPANVFAGANQDMKRNVAYLNRKLAPGEEITAAAGKIPGMTPGSDLWEKGIPEGSDVSYTLGGLTPDHDWKRSDLSDKYKTVTISENGSVLGGTWGAGAAIVDSNVTVHAMPLEYGTFAGWYDGETLLSTDLEYTFRMPQNDVNLTAKFDFSVSVNNLKGVATPIEDNTSEVKLTWNLPVVNLEDNDFYHFSYSILQAQGTEDYKEIAKINDVNTTEYTVSGLEAKQNYKYKLQFMMVPDVDGTKAYMTESAPIEIKTVPYWILSKIKATTTQGKTLVNGNVEKNKISVSAQYVNGRTKAVSTDKFTISPDKVIKNGQNVITVSYTEDGITKEDTVLVYGYVPPTDDEKDAEAKPVISLKTADTFHAFYTDYDNRSVPVKLTNKTGAYLRNPVVTSGADYYSVFYDERTQAMTLFMDKYDKNMPKKVKVKFDVLNNNKYDSTEAEFAVRMDYKKPQLVLSEKTSTIEHYFNISANQTSFVVYAKNGSVKTPVVLKTAVVKNISDKVTAALDETKVGKVSLTIKDGVKDKSFAPIVEITNSDWNEPLTVKHTIKISTKKPVVKLQNKSLILNTGLENASAETKIMFSNGASRDNYETISADSFKTNKANAPKLEVTGNAEGGYDIQVKPGEALAGTYTYSYTPVQTDKKTASRLKLSVTVVKKTETNIKKINIKTTGKLDTVSLSASNITGTVKAVCPQVKVSGISINKITMDGKDVTGVFSLSPDWNAGEITGLKMFAESDNLVGKKQYVVTLKTTLTSRYDESQRFEVLTDIKVKPVISKVKYSISRKSAKLKQGNSALFKVVPYSPVGVTVQKAEVESEYLMLDEAKSDVKEGRYYLKYKDGVTPVENKKYTAKLKLTVKGTTKQGVAQVTVVNK